MKKTHLFMSAFAALAWLGSQSGFGQVADINTQPPAANSSAKSMVKVDPGTGEILIIAIDDPLSGSEIWRSDGTDVGTAQIADLVTGSSGSEPMSLTTVGNRVYFATTQPSDEPSLWITDGQFSGTTKLMEFGSGDGPAQLAAFNGNLFFEASNGSDGRELWRSNGTSVGTVQVQNINSGSFGSAVRHFFPFNNVLYFTAANSTTGREIWKTDGVSSTSLVEDLKIGVDTPFLNLDPEFTAMNGKIYFVADRSGQEGAELWVTDGTATGAQIVKDIISGTSSSSPKSLAVMTVTGSEAGTYLYFSATDGSNGRELWRSDGVAGALTDTKMLKDIRGGSNNGSDPDNLVVVGNTLFFTANDGSGTELFRSTGRTNDANRVTNINDNNSINGGNSNPDNFTPFGSRLIFTAVNSADNLELHYCPAPTGNATRIKQFDVGASASHFTEIDGQLYFLLTTPVATSQGFVTELWKTDGSTEAGTTRVKAFQTGSAGSSPKELKVVNADEAYFSATDGLTGEELWKTDGTEEGTVLIKDIWSGEDSSLPRAITPVGDFAFFTADTTGTNRELWLTDGTEEGTVMVKQTGDLEINPSGASNPAYLTSINGLLYFAARGTNEAQQDVGVEPWVADPSTGIATLLSDILPGSGNSYPTAFIGYQSKVYTIANDRLRELKLPGDSATPEIVYSNALNGPNDPTEVVVLGTGASSTMFIAGAGNGLGTELWKSNGTGSGTSLIQINPGSANSNPAQLTVVGSFLYFVATNGVTGNEIWRINSTASAPTLVKDILAGTGSPAPQNLIEAGGKLFFTADNGTHGRELWVSSGTAATTFMVKDIRAGIQGANITNLRSVDGVVCFSADDGINGTEVWISDGTTTGTTMLGNIGPASASSNPANFTSFNGQLLFSAADPESGEELRMTFIGPNIEVSLQPENSPLANQDTVNLGTVEFKQPAKTVTLTLKNTGLNTLTGVKPLISGINASEFTFGSKVPASISSGATANLILKFSPKEGGTRKATLSILSNDADENPFVLKLEGNGIKDPEITDHPESLMRKVGQSASFTADATSAGSLLPNWKKGSSILKTETGKTLTLPAVTIKDGAAYSYFVKGALATAQSNPAELGVVEDNSPPLVIVQGEGKAVTFKVNASGNQLSYQWFKDDQALSDGATITGAKAKTMTIKGVTVADTGLYTCEVTNPGGTETGGSTQLNVFNEAPDVADDQNMDDGIVGGSYYHQIVVSGDSTKAPLSYSAKGLPPGLKLNTKTGEITGRPTKASPDGFPYKVTVGAKNTFPSVGDVEPEQEVIIYPFPENLAGIYAGTVDHNDELNGGLGGRLDLTITNTGAFSGSLLLGTNKLALKGALEVDVNGVDRPGASISLTPSSKSGLPSPITLTFEINPSTGLLTSASKISVGSEEALIQGWRKLDLVTAAAYDGAYNFGLKLGDPEQQHVDYEDLIPQGWSFGTFKSAKGALKIAGRTADGDKITCASFVGVGGKVVFYQTMYKPLPGSMVGSLTIDPQDTDGEEAATDNTLTGQVEWVKPADDKSKTRTYVAGFGFPGLEVDSPVPLNATGAIYVKPTGLLFGLAVEAAPTALDLNFTFGGLAPDNGDGVDAAVTLNTGNKLTQDPDTTTATKLAINAGTGALTGGFTLDGRKSTLFGLMIKDGTDSGIEKGVGFFTLPEDTTKTSPILGGKVEVQPER